MNNPQEPKGIPAEFEQLLQSATTGKIRFDLSITTASILVMLLQTLTEHMAIDATKAVEVNPDGKLSEAQSMGLSSVGKAMVEFHEKYPLIFHLLNERSPKIIRDFIESWFAETPAPIEDASVRRAKNKEVLATNNNADPAQSERAYQEFRQKLNF